MKKNVLLVDDEELTNTIHTLLLKRSPHVGDVQSVKNGIEALSFIEERWQLKEGLPDIIFLDIDMPEMDGFEFLEKLKSHSFIDRNVLPIVMLSSSSNLKDRSKAAEFEVTGYVLKPLTNQHIAQYITV